MIRRAALLFLVLLAGCGGHTTEPTIHPASPYAHLTFKDASGFNALATDASFVVDHATLVGTVLTVDGAFEIVDGSPAPVGMGRSFEIVLPDYRAQKGARYPMGSAYGNVLTFHERGEGYDHVWVPSGGTIVDEGGDYNVLRVERATLRPVPGTGAEGAATLSGTVERPPTD